MYLIKYFDHSTLPCLISFNIWATVEQARPQINTEYESNIGVSK